MINHSTIYTITYSNLPYRLQEPKLVVPHHTIASGRTPVVPRIGSTGSVHLCVVQSVQVWFHSGYKKTMK